MLTALLPILQFIWTTHSLRIWAIKVTNKIVLSSSTMIALITTNYNKSIHPSIYPSSPPLVHPSYLPGARSQRQQSNQRSPDHPLHRNFLQFCLKSLVSPLIMFMLVASNPQLTKGIETDGNIPVNPLRAPLK